MRDHEAGAQRRYTDEEFASILRTATELAADPDLPPTRTGTLTLREMQDAAAQVGIDPMHVARAAGMLETAGINEGRPTLTERLIGGPLRHLPQALLSGGIDDARAQLLLSTVRIAAGVAGTTDIGHASPVGMTWHDGGELESLRVTARQTDDGTILEIELDRRGTASVVVTSVGIATLLAMLFCGSALYRESVTLAYAGAAVSIGSILTAARAYWVASTRSSRARIGRVMQAIASAPER